MKVILFVWVASAASNGGVFSKWEKLLEVQSAAACQRVAAELGLRQDKFRCVGVEK